MNRSLLPKNTMHRVWEADRRYQECAASGKHPVDSGERTTAVLGGERVTMARCALCGMRYPAGS